MHTLPDEILLEGAAPDEQREVRKNSPLPPPQRIKFVRGALRAEPVTVDSRVNQGGRWQRVALVDPIDTNLVGSACIESRSGAEATRRDHRWHEVALVLDGTLSTENLATGETFHAVKGDLFYWGSRSPADPGGRLPHLLGQDPGARDQRLRARREPASPRNPSRRGRRGAHAGSPLRGSSAPSSSSATTHHAPAGSVCGCRRRWLARRSVTGCDCHCRGGVPPIGGILPNFANADSFTP